MLYTFSKVGEPIKIEISNTSWELLERVVYTPNFYFFPTCSFPKLGNLASASTVTKTSLESNLLIFLDYLKHLMCGYNLSPLIYSILHTLLNSPDCMPFLSRMATAPSITEKSMLSKDLPWFFFSFGPLLSTPMASVLTSLLITFKPLCLHQTSLLYFRPQYCIVS